MAEKRMLTRKITENDNFVTLPATAQALYMHLTMSADDDGFCSQVETALFRAHAKPKDLELLVKRRYLLRFENGVICIKHWRMANTGRADRYTPTVYQEEYNRLTIKPNKAYTLADSGEPCDAKTHDNGKPEGTGMADTGKPNDNQTATIWQPSGNHLATQKRREENRIEENNIYTHTARAPARTREGATGSAPDDFEAFWEAYPRKTGDTRTAYQEYVNALIDGADPAALTAAAKELAERTAPEDFRFLPAAEKWLRNKGWLEKPPKDAPKPSAGKNAKYTTGAEYKPPTPTVSPEQIRSLTDRI